MEPAKNEGQAALEQRDTAKHLAENASPAPKQSQRIPSAQLRDYKGIKYKMLLSWKSPRKKSLGNDESCISSPALQAPMSGETWLRDSTTASAEEASHFVQNKYLK